MSAGDLAVASNFNQETKGKQRKQGRIHGYSYRVLVDSDSDKQKQKERLTVHLGWSNNAKTARKRQKNVKFYLWTGEPRNGGTDGRTDKGGCKVACTRLKELEKGKPRSAPA